MNFFDFRPKASPTALAQMVRCEQQMLFKRKFKDQPNAKRKQSIFMGNKTHKRLEKGGEKFLQGKRTDCFIATSIYGIDAYETNQLRLFRDQHLLTNWSGRCFVTAYYAISPFIARFLDKYPKLKPMSKLVLDKLVREIER